MVCGCVCCPPPQIFQREGKTHAPLLLGDGSHHWWLPQLVCEDASQFPLVESDPACCCIVCGTPPHCCRRRRISGSC